jgi:hypothetical protein
VAQGRIFFDISEWASICATRMPPEDELCGSALRLNICRLLNVC